ncbi:penicillin acylase family protein [Desmospora profundinema]|uniref:Penicillin amidase n=1 Tax=Desmospora profundinema TaxID=1571184 RepID=A0ABU1IHJ5_9BACL|nr:penicillin acylase family protein [Desmospora profundinema]MDR6224166.1 penicillin amidase [Desmospora profundinema]
MTKAQPASAATMKKPRRLKKILTWGAAAMVMILLGGSLYVYNWLKAPLPRTQGTISLQGLDGEVTVRRDRHGVPHIKAESEQDLYVAQGYITAQDRLFQMELSRRVASGRLSEMAGPATLDRDRFFRTLGLRRAAKDSWQSYSLEARGVMEAYTRGVNAYIRSARQAGTLPVEFTLMGFEPERWTPVDSLTIGKYMAYDLGGRWKGQAFRHQLLQSFPEEQARELFPADPADGSDRIEFNRKHSLDLKALLAEAPVPHSFNGSNNWVLAGDKTETGFPLLANDPHLSIAAPAIWYQSVLQAPGLRVSGVTFAGVPGIVVGHNEQIAWGVTNVGPDVQDLYLEKRNPDNPDQFRFEDRWEEAHVRKETIPVKDGKPVTLTVRTTRHGPIVSEFALPEDQQDGETALSMRWTALEPSTELEAILRFNRAQNWEDFKEALSYFHTPAQNFVFASRDGTIAYRANGRIPIRKKGDALLPAPGWKQAYEWNEYIPWEELPTIVNPEEGVIATANNRVVGDDYPYHLTHTWADPYRIERIKAVLSEERPFTADMARLQTDTKNLRAAWMVPAIVDQLQKGYWSPVEQEALDQLAEWNFHDDAELAAPLVYHLMVHEMNQILYEPIDETVLDWFEHMEQTTDRLLRDALAGEPGVWVEQAGGVDTWLERAFRRAVKRAVDRQGDQPSRWQWGAFHQVHFSHPLSNIKPLDRLFNREPLPVGGSKMTVLAADWDKESGQVDHGASWRTVVDLSDLSQARHIVAPGQSGQVMSRWYSDQARAWAAGEMHLTRLNIKDDEPVKTLTLVPSHP